MDELCLAETVDRFCEGIVIAVANAAGGWLHACFRQPLGVLYQKILASTVAVMDGPGAPERPPVMDGLLQRIEHKARVGGAACPPPRDAPGKDIDDGGRANEARPCGDAGEP